MELSADRGDQLFIPPGYPHGSMTLEDNTEVAYKVDEPYVPSADGGNCIERSAISDLMAFGRQRTHFVRQRGR